MIKSPVTDQDLQDLLSRMWVDTAREDYSVRAFGYVMIRRYPHVWERFRHTCLEKMHALQDVAWRDGVKAKAHDETSV